MKHLILSSLALIVSGAAVAQHSHTPPSPYAGEDARAIKSLSDDDIAELRRGGG